MMTNDIMKSQLSIWFKKLFLKLQIKDEILHFKKN